MAKRQQKSKKSQPGRLRIVAGNWRSRLLEIADVPGLRPTALRIRETLFNWLAPEIEGARCLDLYAGTGALGLEALSRGAASVVFVESESKAVATLRRNIDKLGTDRAYVECTDALQYLRNYRAAAFDVVFVDPPYASNALGDVCRALDASDASAPGTKVYVEDERRRLLPDLPANWRVLKERTAGNVRYALLTTRT